MENQGPFLKSTIHNSSHIVWIIWLLTTIPPSISSYQAMDANAHCWLFQQIIDRYYRDNFADDINAVQKLKFFVKIFIWFRFFSFLKLLLCFFRFIDWIIYRSIAFIDIASIIPLTYVFRKIRVCKNNHFSVCIKSPPMYAFKCKKKYFHFWPRLFSPQSPYQWDHDQGGLWCACLQSATDKFKKVITCAYTRSVGVPSASAHRQQQFDGSAAVAVVVFVVWLLALEVPAIVAARK